MPHGMVASIRAAAAIRPSNSGLSVDDRLTSPKFRKDAGHCGCPACMDPSQWLAQLLLTASLAQQQAQAHATEPEGQGVGEAQQQPLVQPHQLQQADGGAGVTAPAGGLAAPQPVPAEVADPQDHAHEQLVQLLLQLQQQQEQQQHAPAAAAAMPQPLAQEQPEQPILPGVPAAAPPEHPPPAAPWHPSKRARLEQPASQAQQQQQPPPAPPPSPQAQAAAWEQPQQQQMQQQMPLQLEGGVYSSPVGSLQQLTQVRPALWAPRKTHFASGLLRLPPCMLPCMLARLSHCGSSLTCPACANCCADCELPLLLCRCHRGC